MRPRCASAGTPQPQAARASTATEDRERIAALAEFLDRARSEDVGDTEDVGAEVLGLLEAHPDPALELEVRLDLSWAASRAGRTGEALEHARRAREIGAELATPDRVARADYHIALAHWYQSELDDAIAAKADQ